jgi:hypothetical protein
MCKSFFICTVFKYFLHDRRFGVKWLIPKPFVSFFFDGHGYFDERSGLMKNGEWRMENGEWRMETGE